MNEKPSDGNKSITEMVRSALAVKDSDEETDITAAEVPEENAAAVEITGEASAEFSDDPLFGDILSQDPADKTTNFVEPKIQMSYLPIHIVSFCVPFFLMLFAFSAIKIYPFGEQQIMVIDSWHQYFPFLSELQTKLQAGDSLLYSWNTGGGTNFLALMSYYASTPLYFLSVFWPHEYLREFMMIITVVKISLAGLLFSIYLRGMVTRRAAKRGELVQSVDKKLVDRNVGLAIVGFSVLYALSAYAVGYYWCIMWLDCMALLPLVILGLENLVENGKFVLYAVAIGLTVICNYYIGFFVCEFAALYFVVYFFVKTPKINFSTIVKKGGLAVGASLLGVGLSAFIMLPAYYVLQYTGNAASTFPATVSTYNSIIDILTNLFTLAAPATRKGLPNVGCGVITIIFGVFYFLSKKISMREKLLYAGLLFVLLLSFNINILDYIWHGFHFPNEIPYRQAFVFSFVLVGMAFRALLEFNEGEEVAALPLGLPPDSAVAKNFAAFSGSGITPKVIGILGITLAGYLLFAEKWYKGTDKFSFEVFYVSIGVVAVYTLFLYLARTGKIKMRVLSVILLILMIMEGGISAVKGAATTGTSGRNEYPPAKENVVKTIADIYEQDTDPFYRLEMYKWYSTNDPVMYGYRGISQFSSEANSRYTRLLEIFGQAASQGSNRYLYNLSTPVFNSIFSLKYIMARDAELNSSVLDFFVKNENVTAYKSKYSLPLGFMVSENISNINLSEWNVFTVQNEFWRKATGIPGDIFRSIYPQDNTNNHVEETRSDYGSYSYKNTSASETGRVEHTYISDKVQEVYLYIKVGSGKEATVKVNGASTKYEINRGVTVDAGKINAGEAVSVSFDIDPNGSGMYQLYVVGFDEELFATGFEVLKNQSFEITEFNTTDIKGTITAKESGIFFSSIPYEKGWSVYVDGIRTPVNPAKEADTKNIDSDKDKEKQKEDIRKVDEISDALVTFPLAEGTHEIRFVYVTDGLINGLVISIASLALLIGFGLFFASQQKKKEAAAVPSD
ncbi:copper ABC transporter permease [Clostridia bacterium]|nr:copper ABC transporter permease [Clostridia bacterium]